MRLKTKMEASKRFELLTIRLMVENLRVELSNSFILPAEGSTAELTGHMRFIRLSSDRVRSTIDFRITSPLAIWWYPDLRPHTAFSFTPNLRNAVRGANSPILYGCSIFRENKSQTNSSAGYLLPAMDYSSYG